MVKGEAAKKHPLISTALSESLPDATLVCGI